MSLNVVLGDRLEIVDRLFQRAVLAASLLQFDLELVGEGLRLGVNIEL